MKRILAAALSAMLILAPLVTAGAADLREEMLDYLVQEKGFNRDHIEMSEVREMVLTQTGVKLLLTYWTYEEGETYTKGEIAWSPEQNRFLLDQEIWDLYNEETTQEQKYFDELAKEAGKIDPWLYYQLKDMNSGDEVSVVLIPTFILTPQLEKAIRDLYYEYELEPPDQLGPYWWGIRSGYSDEVVPSPGYDDGQTEPGDKGSGSSGSSGSGSAASPPPRTGSDGQVSYGDTPVSSDPSTGEDGDEETDIKPALPPDGREPGVMPMPEPDPKIYEFYTKLEQLWLQGYQTSLTALTAQLQAKGISFIAEGAAVLVTAPVSTILSLKDNANIDLITWAITTDDMVELAPVYGDKAANTRLPQMGLSGGRLAENADINKPKTQDPSLLLGVLILTGLLAGAGIAWTVSKRKKSHA